MLVPLNRTISAQIFAESSVRSSCLTVATVCIGSGRAGAGLGAGLVKSCGTHNCCLIVVIGLLKLAQEMQLRRYRRLHIDPFNQMPKETATWPAKQRWSAADLVVRG